jgi:hypothetical protein
LLLSTLMMEAIRSSGKLVLTRATRRNIQLDGILHSHCCEIKKKNSVAFSPQGNHTDCVAATCRRILVPTFADRRVSRGQRGRSPTAVNLSFLDRSRYFSFK